MDFPGQILQGVFGGYSGAAIALVASEAPVEGLGGALGLLQTGQTLGLLVGPTLGGAIADHLSYRAVFMTNGLLAFGAGLITLISVRETSVPAKAPAHGPPPPRATASAPHARHSPSTRR